MIDVTGAAIGFFVMLGLMFLGLHVATAMFLSAALGALIYLGPAQILVFGTTLWAVMNDFILTAIPLFILLGELLMRSGVTHRMYDGLSDWLGYLPGGLFHSNIGASALFASVSGSSVATSATIGTVALPELERRQYNERIALGSIAAGATLGILIPPSVNMIIFGALTKTSIGKLFIAGIIPGLTLTLMFMATILILCVIRPSFAGRAKEEQPPLRDKLYRLRFLLPPLMIFLVVMGTIYFGWATPSEAAAIGVLLAAALAAANGQFKIKVLHEAFISTVRTSALILFIIIAAFFLNFIVGILGIPQALTRFVAEVGATPQTTIWLLVIFYLVLGCFLETLSMMVGTIPVVFPLILHLGIDPVWFGIFLVLMMELALVTPPVGMNLYVVHGVRGHGRVTDVFYGITPFLATMFLMVVVIILFPGLVTWLPNLMF
ncbi:MAG: TRAP transporter large permease [Rhodospirillales bacterium]|jgi:tripartite ATP-independent transporter DctM subunit|nr:TRAP transporter large permease [Rhodospirillales bacterium]